MSSILETFLILFETNSSEVVKGQEQVAVAADETTASLVRTGEAGETIGEKIKESGAVGRFEISELDRFVKRFAGDFIRQTAEMATGLLGFLAVEKLVDGFFETAEMVEHLGLVSEQLGVNVSDLDAWGRAVAKAGGSTQDFEASLSKLNENLQMMQVDPKQSRAAKFFKELGIDALDAQGKVKPVFDLLPELADKFSKLSNVQATGIGEKLGLDPATILVLHEGRQAVDEMIARQKALGVVTQENVEISEKFEDALKDFKTVLEFGTLGALDDILPALTAVLERITDFVVFLRDHEDFVKGFFIGLAGVITTVYGPAMAEATIATIAATWPILLTVAAIGLLISAFALAYDDIANFVKGNNSLLGFWLTQWLGPKGPIAIREILRALGKEFDTFEQNFVKGIDVLIAAWDKFIGALASVEKLPSGILKALGLGSEAPVVLPPGSGPLIRLPTLAPAAPRSLQWLREHPDSAEARAQLGAALGAGQAALAATNTPLAAMPPGALSLAGRGSTVNNNHVEAPVTVNTQATDPKAVADAVNDTMGDHIAHAINHFADGVKA